jgi:hypothetical protein
MVDHDISGHVFIDGITNFSIGALCDLMDMCKVSVADEGLHVECTNIIINRMTRMGLLEVRDGKLYYLTVEVRPTLVGCHDASQQFVFLFRDSNELGHLKTREG